jgi:hypothetical protein
MSFIRGVTVFVVPAPPPSAVKKSLAGRKTKLTPEVRRTILKLVEDGVPWKHIAGCVDVSVSTLCEWKAKRPEFAEAVTRATSRGIAKRLDAINRAAAEDWRAHRFMLSVTDRESFAERASVEVAAAPGGQSTIAILGAHEMDTLAATGRLPRGVKSDGGPVLAIPANGFERVGDGS